METADFSTRAEVDAAADVDRAVVSSLKEETHYSFRVKAVNEAGDSA